MYNETGVKKTMLISPEQDSRLKYFCKRKRISASQLFRLVIDELTMCDWNENLKDNIQVGTMRVQGFIEPKAVNQVKEVVNDGRGNIKTKWFGRWINPQLHNSYPHANHY